MPENTMSRRVSCPLMAGRGRELQSLKIAGTMSNAIDMTDVLAATKGIDFGDNVTTAIDFGNCTTGLSFTGTIDTAIAMSGTIGVGIDMSSGTLTTDIKLSNSATIINTSADLLTITEPSIYLDATTGVRVRYSASAYLDIGVASDGAVTLTTEGTDADFEIATDTSTTSDIIFDAAGDIVLQAAGADIDFGLVGETVDVHSYIGSNNFRIYRDASNYFTITVAADGLATLTTEGTDADFEIATDTSITGDIILDASGDIFLQANGGDITLDAGIDFTGTVATAIEIPAAATVTTGLQITDTCTDGILIDGACTDGIHISGDCTGVGVNISATGIARALMIGAFGGASNLVLTTARNYPLGVFAKVATSEDTTAELRCAYFRLRVDTNIDVGSSPNWGSGLCGAQSQIKFYGGASTTSIYCWHAAGLWAHIETDGVTKVQFEDGCVAAALFAHVGLLSASAGSTTIATGAVACGVAINSGAATNVTATGDYVGLYIYKDVSGAKDFESGILIATGCDKGISLTQTDLTAGLYYEVTQTTSVGAHVHGIKVELTRSGALETATAGWYGAQFVLNAGTDGTALDSPMYAVQAIIKGTSTDAGSHNVNVIRAETQSNGKVGDMVVILANSGSTVAGALLRCTTFIAPSTSIAYLDANTGTSPVGLLIDSTGAGTCTVGIQIASVAKVMAATATMTGSTATNAVALTCNNAQTHSSLYARGLYVNWTQTGAGITGSGEINGIGIDIHANDADVVYLYGMSIYTMQTSNPTLGYVAGISMYLDNMGSAVEHLVALDIGINQSGGDPTGGGRFAFIRCRNHDATYVPHYFTLFEGNGGPERLFYWDTVNSDMLSTHSSGSMSHNIEVYIEGVGSRYIKLYDAA